MSGRRIAAMNLRAPQAFRKNTGIKKRRSRAPFFYIRSEHLSVVGVFFLRVVGHVANALELRNTLQQGPLDAFTQGHVRLAKDAQRLKNMQLTKLGEISATAGSTAQAVTGLDEKVSGNQSDLNAKLAALEEQLVNSVSQFSRSVVDEVNTGIATQTKAGDQMLTDLTQTSAQILSLMGGTAGAGAADAAAPVPGLKQAQVEEIIASLQKILLTQAEITAKINGMKPQKQPSSAAATKPKQKANSAPANPTDDMIKSRMNKLKETLKIWIIQQTKIFTIKKIN